METYTLIGRHEPIMQMWSMADMGRNKYKKARTARGTAKKRKSNRKKKR